MELIRKKDKFAQVPDLWARQYENYPSEDKAETTRLLKGLSAEELTEERINKIIGNSSWTENRCDECGQDHDTLVRIGDDPYYDARWQDLCGDCLAKAALLIAAPSNPAQEDTPNDR